MTADDFLRAYEAALATQDWDQVEPLMHPDVCVTFSSGAQFLGRDEVGGAFSANFAAIQGEQYEIAEVNWLAQAESYAVCTYVFRWTGIVNGKSVGGEGRGTSVLQRDGERWLLLAEHLGPKAPS